MEDADTLELNEYDEETLFLSDVIGDEHELLFLDSYLREAFRGKSAHGEGTGKGGGEMLGEENTI